jgi:hypothetical protein
VPYLLTLANRNDPITVAMPKVAKASTIVAVVCCCRRRYFLRYNAKVYEPLCTEKRSMIQQVALNKSCLLVNNIFQNTQKFQLIQMQTVGLG